MRVVGCVERRTTDVHSLGFSHFYTVELRPYKAYGMKAVTSVWQNLFHTRAARGAPAARFRIFSAVLKNVIILEDTLPENWKLPLGWRRGRQSSGEIARDRDLTHALRWGRRVGFRRRPESELVVFYFVLYNTQLTS